MGEGGGGGKGVEVMGGEGGRMGYEVRWGVRRRRGCGGEDS